MTLSRLPEPDRGVIARSGAIVRELEQLIGPDSVIADEDGRRAFESDALSAYRSMSNVPEPKRYVEDFIGA